MSVSIYINYNGNCREAVEYYATVFNTERPKIMTFGEMPIYDGSALPEELKKLVLNASLDIQGTLVMFADVPPDKPLVIGNNTSIVLSYQNMDEMRSIFGKLEIGGTIIMGLQETFWTKCYGYLTDKFGINWMLTLEN